MIEIGRRTLRTLLILLLVDIVLLIASSVIGAQFRPDGRVLEVLIAVFLVLSGLLLVVPGVAFLVHSIRYQGQAVMRRLRYSATVSALGPMLIGFLFTRIDDDTPSTTIGWVLMLLAVVIITRAWTAPRGDATGGGATLSFGYSIVGLAPFLLMLAFPKHDHRGKAYLTATKSDLRHLESLEQKYFEANERYTASLADVGFAPSTGVNAPKVTVGQGWWYATNSHTQLSNLTCGIGVNTTNPVVATAQPGGPACK